MEKIKEVKSTAELDFATLQWAKKYGFEETGLELKDLKVPNSFLIRDLIPEKLIAYLDPDDGEIMIASDSIVDIGDVIDEVIAWLRMAQIIRRNILEQIAYEKDLEREEREAKERRYWDSEAGQREAERRRNDENAQYYRSVIK